MAKKKTKKALKSLQSEVQALTDRIASLEKPGSAGAGGADASPAATEAPPRSRARKTAASSSARKPASSARSAASRKPASSGRSAAAGRSTTARKPAAAKKPATPRTAKPASSPSARRGTRGSGSGS